MSGKTDYEYIELGGRRRMKRESNRFRDKSEHGAKSGLGWVM